MKNFALKASIAMASILGLNAAQAADGTINFTGDVITSTCKVDAGSTTASLALPKVATSQLATVGATNGRTGFKISVTDCATTGTGIPTQVGVAFESGPSVNPATGQLTAGAAAGAAKGVEIAILNDEQVKIKLGDPQATSNSKLATIGTDGKAVFNYSAEYIATATGADLTAGPLSASLTYSLTYP